MCVLSNVFLTVLKILTPILPSKYEFHDVDERLQMSVQTELKCGWYMNPAVSSRACVLPAFYWLMPSVVPMQTRRMRDKLSSGTINMF